jgi:pyruvate,water dikinase
VVLEGLYDFEKTEQDLADLTETKTKIMVNVENPDRALELSFIPNAGVGFGRLEFILKNRICNNKKRRRRSGEKEGKVSKGDHDEHGKS